ncbi:MAG: hypothetical protein QG608_2025 [Actinomycetota bacterium]|nr:hypothetical protein [Actinomycetota bacterium]
MSPASSASVRGEPGVAEALLRGGTTFLVGIGVVVVAFSALHGAGAAAGAVVGTVLAGLSMAVGPWTLHVVRGASPPTVMAAALGSYGALVLVLGVLWIVLSEAPWLSMVSLGSALGVGVVAWTAGQVRATTRLRLLCFGSDPDPVPRVPDHDPDPAPRVPDPGPRTCDGGQQTGTENS